MDERKWFTYMYELEAPLNSQIKCAMRNSTCMINSFEEIKNVQLLEIDRNQWFLGSLVCNVIVLFNVL